MIENIPGEVAKAKVAGRVATVPLGPDVTLTIGSMHSATVTPSQAGFPALVKMPT